MAQQAQPSGHSHGKAWGSGWLRVDATHELFYEQYGKEDGKPAIFLHGGPGGRVMKQNAAYFDPEQYRLVLLDQRGCGQSRPYAETRDNTTWHLVEDIEKLRRHLGIEKWHLVFGGSWGSTLALAYAQTYPGSVGSLILRGIFAARECELKWSLIEGANNIWPDAFGEFVNFLPEEERKNHVQSYTNRLLSNDPKINLPAARAWNKWEISVSTLHSKDNAVHQLEDETYLLAHARIEAHYFANKAWLEDGQLLKKENIDKIRHIPTTVIQGRYDIVCPVITAWQLHEAFPESTLHLIGDSGHSALEPNTKRKLIETCDEYAKL